jgi:hypothetical protein
MHLNRGPQRRWGDLEPPRMIHAFPAKPSLDTLASRRCLRVPCEAPLSPSKVSGVAQLQLLMFWRQFNPAFQSCWHGNLRIQNRFSALVYPPSRTVLFPYGGSRQG